MDRKPQLHQQTMFDSERPATHDSGPVTCLGMTFEDDEAQNRVARCALRVGGC